MRQTGTISCQWLVKLFRALAPNKSSIKWMDGQMAALLFISDQQQYLQKTDKIFRYVIEKAEL
ncbi:hypothetical protein DSCW_11720 [Desulfosarcina widdelii]|uniref:Uncharacterized protein n=1 Tax=Desulfosarcina widdelii TaxID=947919 RepID=A0A5K7YZ94_9BACT|nr:hypothetical protein DSCW_11720 [Desulfosarcina widdelii]